MREISVQDARDKLGHLIDLVERGEEVMMLRNGKEVARIVRRAGARAGRSRGRWSSGCARGQATAAWHVRLAGMEDWSRRRPQVNCVTLDQALRRGAVRAGVLLLGIGTP